MHGSDFLQLSPERAPRRGRAAWLAEEIRSAISDDTLPVGAKLPATRVLADELSMARGTVAEAYQRLTDEGLLVANRGGGTTVAAAPVTPALPRATPSADAETAHQMIDISSGIPDLSAFPRAAWLRAERQVLESATARELGYADPQGVPQLRSTLAAWLARSRGVNAAPEQVIVTAGVTGALSLLARVLTDRGIRSCGVEDPGAEGNRRVLGYWLDHLIPLPVDDEGLQVGSLASSDLRTVLVTPAHQFPTGVVLSPQRRRELIAWADAVDGVVIEDDYDSEFRYDRGPVRAMQAATPHRVAHVSSLSKVLAPALRLGWLVAPEDMRNDLVTTRWATDLGSPALPQLTLAKLLESGALERHLRLLRRRHRARRDAAIAALHRYLPGCTIEGIAAGLHLVAYLPHGVDDAEVADRARENGIQVQTLSQHRTQAGRPGLVIGYGSQSGARMNEALARLAPLVCSGGR